MKPWRPIQANLPQLECPECGDTKYKYPHRRNVKNLCNACFNRQERISAMMMVGRNSIKCAHCDCMNPIVIDIHHEDADGKLDYGMSADGKMIKTPGNNQRFYRIINNNERDISDLILLCKNCHYIRHVMKRNKLKRQGHGFTSKGMSRLKRAEKLRDSIQSSLLF